MDLIRIENLHKTYHVGEIDVPVLKGVTLTIRRGELVALMGASGSGKSTLMNILGLLDRPTSGSYLLDGEDVSQLPADRRALVRTAKLGFVFQSFNLLPRTTAVNNVLMPLDYSTTKLSPAAATHRARQLLTRVGLGERLDHVPSKMSGGQQQRVAIARSLINQPALLLADEPTGNLDSHTSVEILQMLQQLNESGLTVVLVTHDPKVAHYAHRTIHVKDGLIEGDDDYEPGFLPAPHLLLPATHENGANGNGTSEIVGSEIVGNVDASNGHAAGANGTNGANGHGVSGNGTTGNVHAPHADFSAADNVPHIPHANGSNGNGSNGHGSNGNGAHGNGSHEGGVPAPHVSVTPAAAEVSTASNSALSGGVATRAPAKVRTAAAATQAEKVKVAAELNAAELTTVRPSLGGEAEFEETVRPTFKDLVAHLMPATLRTAIRALRRNLMRSALTTLGIIIGVGAVIAMVEISQGSRSALLKTMSSMGANVLIINSGAAASGGVSWGSGTEKTLTPDDAEEIARQCPAAAYVAPLVQISGQIVYGNRNWVPMSIYGTTPSYLIVREWGAMEDGEMFGDRDVLAANKVCVVGRTLARELFQGESPVGKDIRVKNVSLRVIGVLGRKGANMMGMDQDDIVLAPWTTIKYRISGTSGAGAAGASAAAAASANSLDKVNSLKNLYPGTGATSLYPQQSAVQQANTPQPAKFTNVDNIIVKAASAPRIKEAMSEITELLHERHHLRADEDDDFTIRDMTEIIKAMSSMSQMMGGLLLIVAMISLAVGGVGIMNIMLVSVTERTREIGLRMAVGARSHHILRQFLIEAVVLCLFGGAMGILLGRAATTLVWYFMRWPVQASIPAIVAAFVVSAGVGIAFGFYPAWKASRLDPIEALRYE